MATDVFFETVPSGFLNEDTFEYEIAIGGLLACMSCATRAVGVFGGRFDHAVAFQRAYTEVPTRDAVFDGTLLGSLGTAPGDI